MINRERELRFLTDHVLSDRPEFGVMWGRRRLGKTTLLKALCDTYPSVYFLATQAPPQEQLGRLSRAFADFFQDPLLDRTALPSWEDAFAYLGRNLRERTVLAIDEFPYLVEADPAVPSRFQLGWDEHLGANENAVLILNGSSLSMMEQHVLGARSPLYGRRTGQWQLEPFTIAQFREFFPGRTMVELIELYAVVGGVPFYALQFDPSASLAANVRRSILSKGSVLYQEVPFLLREEFREPRSYFPILAAIASGSSKFGEISSKTGFDKANLSKYLATLQDLRLVSRDVPVTEVNPSKSRRGLYAIDDPFADFWLRYVWPNLAALELERIGQVWTTQIAPDLAGYVSLRCERFVVTILEQPFVRDWLGFEAAVVGKYWDRSVELDLVGLDAKRERAVIGEVKWSRRPVGTNVAESLRTRSQAVSALHPMEKRYVLFSRSGFTDALNRSCPDDVLLVDFSTLELAAPT